LERENTELRCAYEEVLSANGKLQSTNEELRAGNRQSQALDGEVDKARTLQVVAHDEPLIE